MLISLLSLVMNNDGGPQWLVVVMNMTSMVPYRDYNFPFNYSNYWSLDSMLCVSTGCVYVKRNKTKIELIAWFVRGEKYQINFAWWEEPESDPDESQFRGVFFRILGGKFNFLQSLSVVLNSNYSERSKTLVTTNLGQCFFYLLRKVIVILKTYLQFIQEFMCQNLFLKQ